MAITLKSKAELARMRSAGRIVAEVLALVEESLAPGDLDRRPRPDRRAPHPWRRGVPSFLNYLGGRRYDADDPHAYPASTCISIDDEVVHGIPGNRTVQAGQLVSVDVGVIYDGWHGDGARTLRLRRRGAATPEALDLVETTRLALMAGIGAAVVGAQHRRHLRRASRTSRCRAGTASSASTWATASARSMHEDPQRPQLPQPQPGDRRCAPATASRSSRCSRSGTEATRDPRGRLDGRRPRTARSPPTSSTRSR